MEETLIRFETSEFAKEKGFNEETFYGFDEKGVHTEHIEYKSYAPNEPEIRISDYLQKWFYQRPSQAHLQKWLMEKHSIDVVATPVRAIGYDEISYWTYFIKSVSPMRNNYKFKTYEDALEIGLQNALELIN